MARELHDIVAHGMSVMLVQTAAARQVMDTAPLRANEALRDAEAAGRDAMGELRHLLAVLNDDGEIGGIAPQPGVEQLEGLIGRVRDAGLPVGLSISGEPRPLAPGVDITAYRIVQEALTNALRYAGGARTFVELAFEPAELRVEVLDDGPMLAPSSTDGAGRGLAGLGERVTKVGGRLEAGPRLGGGFAVRAWLPQRPSQ
jgi:signal transduction histidine kinase